MDINELRRFDSKHNLLMASGISLVVILMAIFTAREVIFPEITEGDESIEFIDFEQISPRRRAAKKEISTEEGQVAEDSKEAGSESENFVDLDYHQNVKRPSLVGRFKIKYPQVARENEVGATIQLQLFISSKGEIKRINIFRVRLSKQVPDGLKVKIIDQFKQRIIEAMRGRRYRPAVINGKPTATKSIQTLELTYR